MIELNAKAITDEMMALSALRALISKTDSGDSEGRRLLTADQLPGLRVVMRMVFAETMLELGPAVEECSLDGEDQEPAAPYDDDTPLRMGVTLRHSGDFPSGMELTVKRHLEHIVAAGTLGWVATDGDADFATMLQNKREAALGALRDHLAGQAGVMRRAAWP